MRILANELGVSATAIYRHFNNKKALMAALVEVANAEFSRYLLCALQAEGPEERLQAAMTQYWRFAFEQMALYDILFTAVERGWLSDAADRKGSPNFQIIVDRVRECVAEGLFKPVDCEAAATSFWSLAHGLIALFRQGRFARDEEAFEPVYLASISHLTEGFRTRGC